MLDAGKVFGSSGYPVPSSRKTYDTSRAVASSSRPSASTSYSTPGVALSPALPSLGSRSNSGSASVSSGTLSRLGTATGTTGTASKNTTAFTANVADTGNAWKTSVPTEVLATIPPSEITRQIAIHDLIAKESAYLGNLVVLEADFLGPLVEWLGAITDTNVNAGDDSYNSLSLSPPPTPSGSIFISGATSSSSPPHVNPHSSSGTPLTPSSALPANTNLSSSSSPLLGFAKPLYALLSLLPSLITSHQRLIDALRVRARESQYGIIEGIGDIYLEKATGVGGWRGGWSPPGDLADASGYGLSGGGSGYDEWVAVWSLSGLGDLSVYSAVANGMVDEDKTWGNEEWKRIVSDQEQSGREQDWNLPHGSEDKEEDAYGEGERRVNGKVNVLSGEGAGRSRIGMPLPNVNLKRLTQLVALPALHLRSYPSLLSEVLAVTTSSLSSDVGSAPGSSSSQPNSTNPKPRRQGGGGNGKDKQRETSENPDASYLREAIKAMRALFGYAKVKTFQMSMSSIMSAGTSSEGQGGMGEAALKWEWFDLVSDEEKKEIGRMEVKRQAIIFELIKGEMAYVKDLENVEHMYVTPLVTSSTSPSPIISATSLPHFLSSVFHNISSLHKHHLSLLLSLFRIQYDDHPTIRSISAPLLDAALNWREAYMEYIPNYPIAAYMIDKEMRVNPAFKEFVERCTRLTAAHRLDMKNFVNRPIPRLLRYELLLKGVLEETPLGPVSGVTGGRAHRQGSRAVGSSSSRGVNLEHEDHSAIPQVLDVIRGLGKDTEPGVVNAKSKVELWKYNEGLVFKQEEWIDMDLLDSSRSLIYSGKLLRQPDGLDWSGWTELHVLLFDNYIVLTKPKERDDVTKYHVNRRPIPLDLLSIDSLIEPPVQRSTGPGLLRGLRSQGGIPGHEATFTGDPLVSPKSTTLVDSSTPTELSQSSSSSPFVYPITLHHLGRPSLHSMSGFPTPSSLSPSLSGSGTSSRIQQAMKPPPNVILYAESSAARVEWGAKLQEALGIRRVVQESNKVFEVEVVSGDTFLAAAVDATGGSSGVLGGVDGGAFTGNVTCSVPFNTTDGRGLIAVGCAEGVWIGFRHDPKSMRRVLHLKFVTQCAMLEDYGIFLVLADKSLFAYHIEALVPSSLLLPPTSQQPQKLNGNKDVHFFAVGMLHGRTLVIYMKKKGLDSIFRVLEPVSEKINERAKVPSGFGSKFFPRSAKSEWFKIYRDFFLPSESYDLIFLKARIAILCSKGFEIMDLNDFKSVTIPQRDDPRLAYLAKRCESCRPIGMFKSAEDEFLLCYNEFGVYVDKHGDPNRAAGTIEWEGTADRVAVHAPYILLFDPRFIEVRHLETGRLAQIITGNDIRCVWDGRGVSSHTAVSPSTHTLTFPGPDGSGLDEPFNQDSQVHAVMNSPEILGGLRSPAVVQHVFELLPTVPLFLPHSHQQPDLPGNHPNNSGSHSGGGSVVGSYSNSGSGSGSGSGVATGSRLFEEQYPSNTSPLLPSPQLRNL
ncbi:CNH domain-containing protein [Rhodocollybia butyracea]|uniref:CNH domain-containing protein n=1 Tax=Rhodocollybia butyracea TaxID=206335 RepID=A0A9P5U138_9AGAR|nr:CNH domain-containing protein [Rhodocollybia butyracea]